MTFPAEQEDLSAVCPYLGLADDADSHATYATEAHRCYRLEQPTRIASGHQESYCLGSNHVTCPVYRGEGIGATSRAGAAAGAAGAAAASAGRAPRGRAPREGRGAPAGRGRDAGNGSGRSPALDRKRPTGTLGPKPRGGGISMPTATIALFALAAVVLVLAFVLNQALGGGGDDSSLSAADRFASQQAQTRTQQPGGGDQTPAPNNQTPAGNGTPATATTPAGNGTPAATPTTGSGSGSGSTYAVEAGDNCGRIASAHDLTLDEFMDLNPGIECTNLQIGQEVNVG